jgi:iron complex outermembrane receptor protein
LHASYQTATHFQFFAQITYLLDWRYSTSGILSDPTGVAAPGIPSDGVTNDPGINNRIQSPAAPSAAFAGGGGSV